MKNLLTKKIIPYLAAFGVFASPAYAAAVESHPECPKTECPSPTPRPEKKRSTNPSCLSLYDGKGMCLQEPVAAALGLTEADRTPNHCPGRSTFICYDTSKVNIPVPEALSDLEKFTLTLASQDCEDEHQKIQDRYAEAITRLRERTAAEKAIKDYAATLQLSAETSGPESVTPVTLLTKALAAQSPIVDAPKVTELLNDFTQKDKVYQDATRTLEDYINSVKEHGCRYDPESAKPKNDVHLVSRFLTDGSNSITASGLGYTRKLGEVLSLTIEGGYFYDGNNHKKTTVTPSSESVLLEDNQTYQKSTSSETVTTSLGSHSGFVGVNLGVNILKPVKLKAGLDLRFREKTTARNFTRTDWLERNNQYLKPPKQSADSAPLQYQTKASLYPYAGLEGCLDLGHDWQTCLQFEGGYDTLTDLPNYGAGALFKKSF